MIASIDTGGTFTDGHFTKEGRSVRVKVETTPHDFTECFVNCLEAGAEAFEYRDLQAMLLDTDILRFASTIATNAMIEHKGPRIGLAVSAGHADDLYGDGDLLYDALLDHELVVELDDPDDENSVRSGLRALLEAGARVLVVSFSGALEGLEDEVEVKRTYERAYPRHYLGAVPCLPASEVTRRSGDARRTNTAVVNAYLHPELVRTLYKADEDVRSRGYPNPLLIVHGSGGVARVAKTRAIEQYNCGPAGGIYGASVMASRYDLPAALTLDMGGTSTDYSYVQKDQIPFDLDPHIEDIPVWTPLVDVGAFGCGGSSIVSRQDGEIQVGPESMGSAPGPACYGLGGTSPTPTDAHLVLGTLDPENYLGGRRKLDPDRARTALATLGPGDDDVEQIARDVHDACVRLVVEHFEEILGDVDARPEDSALFAFGGAGGLFGADVARRLGLPRVYSFADAAVFSAFGVSGMDVAHLYDLRLTEDKQKLVAELDRRRARAELDMAGEGLDESRIEYRVEAETDDGLVVFDAAPDGWEAVAQKAIETSARWLRLRASVAVPRPEITKETEGDADPSSAQTGTRGLHLDPDGAEANIYDRDVLTPGMRIEGPAIIEAKDTTTLVPPGAALSVDGYYNGIIEFGG